MESQANKDVVSHIDRAKSLLLSYIGDRISDEEKVVIGRAVEFSIVAHKNQFRKSGMPYVEHPFEVAKILVDFKMDSTTIIAGLLHDVIEDTSSTSEELEEAFGKQVAFLVEGVTKISAIQANSHIERQAETFRKMLVSVAKDFRVIMIKFADRLHNMRTLGYMKEEKKKLISTETMEVYAPLAHRFGLAKIRAELEDLAFRNLNFAAYKQIVTKVVERKEGREEYIRSLIPPIKEVLESAGIQAVVHGRPKHLYSIYKKLESRKCRFEDLYDLFALRIIVETKAECYAALGAVHNLWIPLQTRFKDFIAAPKSNMYQSLHTTLVGPQEKPVEVQIRTGDMDETAENGIAAHWAYKEGKMGKGSKASKMMEKETEWLKQFMEWQKDIQDSAEFMDFFRIDLKTEEIYVFSPKGDLITLPKGATALDFAFAVHSEVGEHCIGAKMEGRVVPLGKVLQTGTTVEILTSSTQVPTRDWLRVVVTLKAKNRIRRWLRSEMKDKSIQLGKELLNREFQNLSAPDEMKKDISIFKEKFGIESWEDFHLRIGNGDITLGSIKGFIEGKLPKKSKSMLSRVGFKRNRTSNVAVMVSGMDNLMVRFASCCQPLPGDEIVGYVTKGRGVSIHRANCPDGIQLMKEPDRRIPVGWKSGERKKYDVFIEVLAKDKKGLLHEITDVFDSCGVNVERASIATVRGQVRNKFKLQVSSVSQLDSAFKLLSKIKEVKSISRKTPHHSDAQGKESDEIE